VLNFPPQGIRNPNTGDITHTANIAFPNLKIGALCLGNRAGGLDGADLVSGPHAG